jgi:uncharacterized protein YndB with AHSA1/START domain
MAESLQLSTLLPASPDRVYRAWIDGGEHAAFTGTPAEIDPVVGGRFSAWDGYISGVTLALEPGKRILQAWRTTEFPPGSPDSSLEILLEPAQGGTSLSLQHTAIPDGQGESYAQGWEDYYFGPLRSYFTGEA